MSHALAMSPDRGEKTRALDDMRRRWPQARRREDAARTAGLARRIFDPSRWRGDRPLRLVMIGTETHASRAVRAVGVAIGKNPIAFVVPCHRVIGKCGDLTGYHWGLIRKRAMLGWEAGRVV